MYENKSLLFVFLSTLDILPNVLPFFFTLTTHTFVLKYLGFLFWFALIFDILLEEITWHNTEQKNKKYVSSQVLIIFVHSFTLFHPFSNAPTISIEGRKNNVEMRLFFIFCDGKGTKGDGVMLNL